MAAIHITGFMTVLVLCFFLQSSAEPGHDHHHHHHHTKHVIHTPLHIKMIHHHKIIKVPVVYRKHHHHHKHFSEDHVYIPLKHKPKPVYEESAGDGIGGIGGGIGAYPVKVVKIIKPSAYEVDGDSAEGSSELQGHYLTQIRGTNGGHGGQGVHGGYEHGSDRSEDYNSYEYEESQENLQNGYHGRN